MPTNAPRALVVGAVTWDQDLDRRRGVAPRPGGVATFAGRAFAGLGARTRVVTRVAPADATVLEPLRHAGVEVLALASERTTTYGNRYGGEHDRHELLDRSDPIRPGDVPPGWLRDADVVHAGPLHPHDVEPGSVVDASGLIGVDLQGLVRDASLRHDDVQRLVREWCGIAAVVQVSVADAAALFDATSPRAIRSAYGIRELIVTGGSGGATVATSGGVVEIPVPRIVRGETRGAGDTHLAVYLLARHRQRSPRDAGSAAATVTADVIETGTVPALTV